MQTIDPPHIPEPKREVNHATNTDLLAEWLRDVALGDAVAALVFNGEHPTPVLLHCYEALWAAGDRDTCDLIRQIDARHDQGLLLDREVVGALRSLMRLS